MKLITYLFPVWAIALSAVALSYPDIFVLSKPAIIPLLAVVMFGMGMTLTFEDFKRVVQQPRVILLGVGLQFLVMPLMAYLISIGLDLPLALLTGMVLVGASSGGTASNVICYLAKGDVALSISLTLCSTLIAVVAMPLLTLLYLGERVPVPVMGMLWTVAKIILGPVIAGVLLNQLLASKLTAIKQVFPLVSVIAIVFIIAIIVAVNQQRLEEIGVLLALAVILHNSTGLLSGYAMSRWLGYDAIVSRTIAIEVGMQNSGLSVAMAIKYFSPLAALPGAVFSIWHNISGALLASFWARKTVVKQ